MTEHSSMGGPVITSTAGNTRQAHYQKPTIQNCPSVYNRRYITSRITGGLCAGGYVRLRLGRLACLSRSCDQLHLATFVEWAVTSMFMLPAGLLLLGGTQPAQAAVSRHSQLVLLDTSNTAVLQSLKQLNKAKDRFGSQAPPAALSSRFIVSFTSCSLEFMKQHQQQHMLKPVRKLSRRGFCYNMLNRACGTCLLDAKHLSMLSGPACDANGAAAPGSPDGCSHHASITGCSTHASELAFAHQTHLEHPAGGYPAVAAHRAACQDQSV